MVYFLYLATGKLKTSSSWDSNYIEILHEKIKKCVIHVYMYISCKVFTVLVLRQNKSFRIRKQFITVFCIHVQILRDDINIFNVSMKIINRSISFSVIFYPPFLFTNKNFSYFYVGKKRLVNISSKTLLYVKVGMGVSPKSIDLLGLFLLQKYVFVYNSIGLDLFS